MLQNTVTPFVMNKFTMRGTDVESVQVRELHKKLISKGVVVLATKRSCDSANAQWVERNIDRKSAAIIGKLSE